MKRYVAIGFVLLSVIVLCMSGCSDFRFNPIGTWTFSELKEYKDGKLIQTITSDEDPYMKEATLTFKKSGTGYIGGNKKDQKFTYEYTDDSVTLNITDKSNDNYDVDYEVRDNGGSLVRIIEKESVDENGKKVSLREEVIFKR